MAVPFWLSSFDNHTTNHHMGTRWQICPSRPLRSTETAMNKLCPQGHTYSGGRCSECRRPPETTDRKYDHRWNMLSKRYRALNPVCEDCDRRGRTTPASEVHHIVPILENPALRLVWTNLVALCHGCHVQRHRELDAR